MVQISKRSSTQISFSSSRWITIIKRQQRIFHISIAAFIVLLGTIFLMLIIRNNDDDYNSSNITTMFDTTTTTTTTSDNDNPSSKSKIKKRVSYEELYQIMSPTPDVNPSTVPRVTGMMVKCDIERWSGYLRREHYYIYDGLVQIYGWKEINLDQVRILATAAPDDGNELPDVLFLCEPAILHLNHLLPWLRQIKEKSESKSKSNSSKKKVHIAYHTDDLSSLMNKVETEQLGEAFDLFDTYMGTYAYRIQHYLQNVPIKSMPNIVWIPHSVSPEFINHRQTSQINNNSSSSSSSSSIIKRNKILLPGKINNQYPLRQWASKEYEEGNLPMLEILPHSGYSWDHSQDQQYQFANHIASYSTAFTCGLFYHYIVAKIFEIPSVGTLLLVNDDISDLLLSLGFVESKHYKSYNSMNPKPTFEWVVNPENYDVIDSIRQAGKDLIFEQHQVGHRVYAIASYFATGQILYPIPQQYKNNPCPMIIKPNYNKCMEEFTNFATKPLLPVK